MFFPEKLVKIRAFCTKSRRASLVDALYEFGVIHVSDAVVFSTSKPLDQFRVISEKLIVLRALSSQLNIAASAGVHEKPLDELLNDFERLSVDDLSARLRQVDELRRKVAELEDRQTRLRPFRKFDLDASLLESKRLLFAYFSPGPNFSWNALQRASPDTKGLAVPEIAHEALVVRDGKDRFVFLAYDAGFAEKVRQALALAEKTYEIPKVSGTFAQAWEELELQVQSAHADLAAVQKRIDWFVQHKSKTFADLLADFEIAAKKAELPTRFGQSANFSAAEGWIPARRLKELEHALKHALGESVVLETIPTKQTPPTKLDNPRVIRPFEFMVKALSLPSYHELDPTVLTFISFPIFFGMILGDVGYGLAMVALALFVRRKFKTGFFRSVSGMMLLSGIWTVAWGFVFGEFLGAESLFGFYPLHPIIHRLEPEGILHLMQLSLLFGFIHLSIGFAVGALVAYREGHLKHVAAKISWLAMLVSMVGFLSVASHIEGLEIFKAYGRYLPADLWLGLIGASLAGLLVWEGAGALFELPGLLGNLVSYLRIMALGIVGVVLAGMVNQIPLKLSFDPAGLLFFVVFAFAFVLGQMFALALGIFESSIQSLRLHYVEFFSKFYRGGGVAFVALREDSIKK